MATKQENPQEDNWWLNELESLGDCDNPQDINFSIIFLCNSNSIFC